MGLWWILYRLYDWTTPEPPQDIASQKKHAMQATTLANGFQQSYSLAAGSMASTHFHPFSFKESLKMRPALQLRSICVLGGERMI
jgi:hypothetical protein